MGLIKVKHLAGNTTVTLPEKKLSRREISLCSSATKYRLGTRGGEHVNSFGNLKEDPPGQQGTQRWEKGRGGDKSRILRREA